MGQQEGSSQQTKNIDNNLENNDNSEIMDHKMSSQ